MNFGNDRLAALSPLRDYGSGSPAMKVAGSRNFLAGGNKTSDKTLGVSFCHTAVSGSPPDNLNLAGALSGPTARVCVEHLEAPCGGYSLLLSWFWHPLASRRDVSILRRRLTLQ